MWRAADSLCFGIPAISAQVPRWNLQGSRICLPVVQVRDNVGKTSEMCIVEGILYGPLLDIFRF